MRRIVMWFDEVFGSKEVPATGGLVYDTTYYYEQEREDSEARLRGSIATPPDHGALCRRQMKWEDRMLVGKVPLSLIRSSRRPRYGHQRQWMYAADLSANTSSDLVAPVSPTIYQGAVVTVTDPVIVRFRLASGLAMPLSAPALLFSTDRMPASWLEVSEPALRATLGRRFHAPVWTSVQGCPPLYRRFSLVERCELDRLFDWPWVRRKLGMERTSLQDWAHPFSLVLHCLSWPNPFPDNDEMHERTMAVYRELRDYPDLASPLRSNAHELLERAFMSHMVSSPDIVPMGTFVPLIGDARDHNRRKTAYLLALAGVLQERRMEIARRLEPWLREYILGFEVAPQVMASQWLHDNLMQMLMLEFTGPRPDCQEGMEIYLQWFIDMLCWYGLSEDSAKILATFGQRLGPLLEEPPKPAPRLRYLWSCHGEPVEIVDEISARTLTHLAAQLGFVVVPACEPARTEENSLQSLLLFQSLYHPVLSDGDDDDDVHT